MKMINRKYILAGFIVCGLIFYGVSMYVQNQQAEYVAMMKLLISQQETTLISLAEVTDRNGADATVSGIIKDCEAEDRQQFDALLGTLGSLNRAELIEVDQLFAGCGSFSAERKALMTARLRREYEVYSDYVDLLNVVDSKVHDITYPVGNWAELVALEKERSGLLSDLVEIQKDIITALLDGASLQSEQMLAEVTKAQEAKDTLSYTGVRIDTLRDALIGL